jgi:PadR family transcriptional regulator, regulatory protein PadR
MTKRSDSAKPESLGEFEQCLLLAVVHLGQEAYGVTIRQEIDRRTNREVAIGALYTSLDRLERKGYLRSAMSHPTPQRGGRSKRYFMLTPRGAIVLRQSRERMTRMWAGLSPDLRKARS